MASNKKDWRGGRRGAGGGVGGGASSPQETAPDFMRRRDTKFQEINKAHWGKMGLWGVVFAGLVGLLVYWLLFWPVRPPLVIATVTQYDYPLPPNAWTAEDQESLMALDGQGIVRCRMEKDAGSRSTDPVYGVPAGEVADYNAKWTGLSEKAAFAMLEAKIREAEQNPGGPRKDVVLLYVGMHGVVNKDGEPCLVPPGPFAHDSSKWFSAKTLLEQLFGKKKKGVKYVVFFDCSRVDADWSLGWLYAGFSQRLGDTLKDLAYDNVYVITSSGPGQVSWTAPELKGSVFGRFLYRGLQGRADRFGGNSNNVVTLKELFRYLRLNVSDWVKTYRDDEQTPMLFGKEGPIDVDNDKFKKDDFPLVAVPEHPRDESSASDGGEPSGQWEEIAKAWEKHAELRKSGAAGRSPLKWQEYQHRLLYLDQLALAGKVGESKIGAQFAQVRQLADELQKRDAEEIWPGYSLPQAKLLLEKLKQEAAAKPAGAGTPNDTGENAAGKPGETTGVASADRPAGTSSGGTAGTQSSGTAGTIAGGTAGPVPGGQEKATGGTAGSLTGGTAGSLAGGTAGKSPPAGKAEALAGDGKTGEKAPGPAPDYLVAAESVWQRFGGADADFSLLDDLPRLPDERKADLVEMHFLRMLKAWLGPVSPDRPLGIGDLRLAVKSRRLAEDAAWPRDLRAQYAIRGTVQQADRQRRMAEDRLFAGGTYPDNESPRSYWKRADENEGYAAAQQTAEDVADAFRVRDEVLAEIPGYAQWLLRKGQPDAKLEDQLRTLIEKTVAFSANIDRTLQEHSDDQRSEIRGQRSEGPPTSDFRPLTSAHTWPKELKTAKGDVAGLLTALRAEFESECNHLDKRDEGSPKDEFRRLGVVLSVALESGPRRNRLRQRYNEILEAAAKAAAGKKPETDATDERKVASSQPELAAGAKFRDRWKTHPALLILGETWSAKPQIDPLTDLAAQGEEVRKKLNGALDDAHLSVWRGKDPDAPDPKLSPWAARSGYAEGDREARTVAALWAGRELPAVDLSAELRRVDRRNLLLWHAQRTLDDFWGPTPGQSKPYFQIVAEEYLAAANSLSPPCPLAQTVALRAGEVAHDGVVRPVDPSTIYLDSESSRSDPQQVQVTLKVSPGLIESGGKAAVFFQDQERHPLAIRERSDSRESVLRRPVPDVDPKSSGDSVTWKTFLALGATAGNQKLAPSAVALYRGHVASIQIPVVITPPGPETVVTFPQRVPPVLLVTSSSPRRTSIIFIFDCSFSMNTPDVDLHLEAANAKKKGATRMYWAREQLKTILARLAKQPNQYRVGLLAYGSRYAYDKRAEDDPEARANKMKYFRGRPPSGGDLALIAQPTAEQDPDTDCEELLKLADFDENQRAIAESKLDGLKATGQTPLYYSVVKAIELLKEDRENRGHKRIVVITDGINDQSYLVDAKDKRIKNDVAWALKEANKSIDVRLEVIAFCIKPDPGQEEAQYRENLEDLKSLVQEQKQGGSYAASDRPEGLLGALEKLVETEKFVLCQGERQLAQIDADKRFDLDLPASETDVPYSLSVNEGESAKAQAKMEVEGGEFIKLRYEDERETGGSPRLVFDAPTMEQTSALDHALLNGLDGHSQYDVTAINGTKNKRVATFPVIIQNHKEGEFSYRPKSVWAEIIPLFGEKGDQEGPGYTFYDLCFANGSQVPKLEFRAAGWPDKARKAKVRLWFKFSPTDADEEPSLNGDRWRRVGDASDSRVCELGGSGDSREGTVVLRWKLEEKSGSPSCAVVVEQTVPAEMDLHSYKIELKPPQNSASPGPDEVHCRSLPPHVGQNGRVIQTFVFRVKPADILSYRVCITAKKKILMNALSPARELEVHVE